MDFVCHKNYLTGLGLTYMNMILNRKFGLHYYYIYCKTYMVLLHPRIRK